MIQAIVYMSNTGYTAEYARMLGEKTGLPVLTLDEAKKSLPARAPILYLGWLMAGSIKGCGAAIRRFSPRAVCGVGMWQTGTQQDAVRKKTGVPASIPVFTLQGNFDVKKLHGIYRPMMEITAKTVSKSLAAKSERTPDEDDILELMLRGGERVKPEHLSAVLSWYNAQK